MINITDPQYWDKTSLLRAKQVWQSENQAEKEIIDDFIIFLEQVKREVGDLYAEYSVEGLLNYAEVNRMVNAGQLAVYRRMIEQVMNETQQIQDEYYNTGKVKKVKRVKICQCMIGIKKAIWVIIEQLCEEPAQSCKLL